LAPFHTEEREMRAARIVAAIGSMVATAAVAQLRPQVPPGAANPSSGTRIEQPEFGALTRNVQPLNIVTKPPPAISMLAPLDKCATETMPGSSRVSYRAQPGMACLSAGTAPGGSGATLPAQEWLVETNGGVEPIELTATAQLTQFRSLFTVLPGTGNQMVVAVDTAREAIDAGLQRGEPAGKHAWRVRFAGMPFDDAAREILVQLVAKDGAGKTTATDFRLYPYSPRIVAAPASVPTFSPTAMSVRLTGIGMASSINLHSTVTGASCGWYETGGAAGEPLDLARISMLDTPVTVTAWSSNFEIIRSGVFANPAAPTQHAALSCYVKLDISLTFPRDAEQSPRITLAAAQPTTLQARKHYTIDKTDSLRTKWGLFDPPDIRQRPDMGTCSGTSVGPSNYSVGLQPTDGDLSFRIRSGPLGTNCEYSDIRTSKDPIVLPAGVLLVDSSWASTSGTSCRAVTGSESGFTFDRAAWTTAPDDLDTLMGLDKTLVHAGSGAVIHDSSVRSFRSVLRSVLVHLKCDATAVNDQEARMTLQSVTLSAPDGWAGL
jgi:hypothetical protein